LSPHPQQAPIVAAQKRLSWRLIFALPAKAGIHAAEGLGFRWDGEAFDEV
jgi:hypothetical protein